MVKLSKVVPGGAADIFVKLEWFNPTGSYKDRMALAIIEEAERRGDLRPGMTVVEYTGGSTGSSLAFVCAAKGYHFKVVSSDAFAQEKLKTMQAFGAEVTIVPSEGGMITPDLIPRMIEKAKEYAAEPGTYFTNQFHNRDALVGHRRFGEELLAQIDRPIDVFCTAVGTAGFSMGVSGALREASASTRVVLFEPSSTAVISGKPPGTHHVEGIGVGFVPPLLDESLYDEVRAIDENEARVMARRLAAEEGLLTGTSSGLNVVGAIGLAQELGPEHLVATVAVDTGLKYLAGDLFDV
ncbi:MAG: cysteine synthase family protein [Actinomycetota bacterium]|nr:cysteine synthase family protein [Actinomycetota bacterium]